MDSESENRVASQRRPEISDVRQALEWLYDNAALAACRLASYYPQVAAESDPCERAQALRSLLLDAIESLRPLRSGARSWQPARAYEVLSLRYAYGLSVEQIAGELCVGARQIYRDLRRGEEKLCEVLGSRSLTARFSRGDERLSAMRSEVDAMPVSQQVVDGRDILQAVTTATRPLALSFALDLVLELPSFPLVVRGTPGMLRACLIQLVSNIIQAGCRGTVLLRLDWTANSPCVSLTFTPTSEVPQAALAAPLSSARALGLECSLREIDGGLWQVQVRLPAALPQRVLIVEDNPGTIELYRRYLEGTGWQVTALSQSADVLSEARRLHPDVIVLDIMMPDVDGWSVLQALKLDPDTASVPVLVCSVVHDPGLARTLGADSYITKPVSRLSLLMALRQLLPSSRQVR